MTASRCASLFLLMLPILTAAVTYVPRAAGSSDETSAARAKEVQLLNGTWKDVETLVRQHRGKVVVVDIWSTSCLPCMTEFPNLVRIHREQNKDIVCVSFNVDYAGIKKKPPETYRPRVEEFLRREKADCINFLCTDAADEVFQSLELSSIPAVYVYDRTGRLAKRFDGSLLEGDEEEAFTYKDDIDPFLAELLKAKP